EEIPIKWPIREASHNFWDPTFTHPLFDEELPIVIAVEPFRRNERMNIQRGLFLTVGDLRRPIMDFLTDIGSTDLGEHVRKYVLDLSMQEEALHDLNRMNINSASLFPGLDGYARSLRLYPFIDQRDERLR